MKKPIPGVTIRKNEKNDSVWFIDLEGPDTSPYKGGVFTVEADFSDNYPFKPPQCKFLTKIYNPSIRKENGEICKDLYVQGWNPSKNIRTVIDVFLNVLANPAGSETPLEAEIAK